MAIIIPQIQQLQNAAILGKHDTINTNRKKFHRQNALFARPYHEFLEFAASSSL